MNEAQIYDDEMPAEINFSGGIRGLHYIPPRAKILMPASIRDLSEIWRRDIEINEALK